MQEISLEQKRSSICLAILHRRHQQTFPAIVLHAQSIIPGEQTSPSRQHLIALLQRESPQIMTQTYPIKSRSDDERLVREWGFKHVFTWTDGRYTSL